MVNAICRLICGRVTVFINCIGLLVEMVGHNFPFNFLLNVTLEALK